VRAYATNAAGTSYGNEVTFTTCTLNTAGSATSTTGFKNTAITPITLNTTGATGIGAPTGLPAGVTASWSNDVITISGTPTATGNFTYTIPLTGGCGSVNATGTITLSEPPFVCGSSSVTIDGYDYPTVSIGTQCWTKENLRVRRYSDGTEIRFDKSGGSGGNSSSTWATGNYGAYTIYAHDSVATPSSNLSNYGYLYNWYAVKGIITNGGTSTKNICPSGWHVPTDAEWTTLTTYLVGGNSGAGRVLKKNDALWTTNTGTNTSGFSVLPGGVRTDDGRFVNVRYYATFWTASDYDGNDAWFRYIEGPNNNVSSSHWGYSNGCSVRCLKD
jgi:uncharacterized protein (TIGR02145 family)